MLDETAWTRQLLSEIIFKMPLVSMSVFRLWGTDWMLMAWMPDVWLWPHDWPLDTVRQGWPFLVNTWTGISRSCVLFSDESRFCVSTNDRRQRVWRARGERFAECAIVEHDRFGGPSVMVWAGISRGAAQTSTCSNKVGLMPGCIVMTLFFPLFVPMPVLWVRIFY